MGRLRCWDVGLLSATVLLLESHSSADQRAAGRRGTGKIVFRPIGQALMCFDQGTIE